MKQSIIKKIICAVLAATLIFGAAPVAMAQTPTAIVAQAETEAQESNDFVLLQMRARKTMTSATTRLSRRLWLR